MIQATIPLLPYAHHQCAMLLLPLLGSHACFGKDTEFLLLKLFSWIALHIDFLLQTHNIFSDSEQWISCSLQVGFQKQALEFCHMFIFLSIPVSSSFIKCMQITPKHCKVGLLLLLWLLRFTALHVILSLGKTSQQLWQRWQIWLMPSYEQCYVYEIKQAQSGGKHYGNPQSKTGWYNLIWSKVFTLGKTLRTRRRRKSMTTTALGKTKFCNL